MILQEFPKTVWPQNLHSRPEKGRTEIQLCDTHQHKTFINAVTEFEQRAVKTSDICLEGDEV